jgi:hypothetical protein
MDPKTVQIDFEWARCLEQTHGGFNFGKPLLILDEWAAVCAMSEFAFEIS